MYFSLIKVEILYNTLFKGTRERSAKRSFYLAFSHLFCFLFCLCGCFHEGWNRCFDLYERKKKELCAALCGRQWLRNTHQDTASMYFISFTVCLRWFFMPFQYKLIRRAVKMVASSKFVWYNRVLRRQRGDGNENGKKAIGLKKQNNNFTSALRFFVHFFAVVARLRRETSFMFCGECKHTGQRFCFSSPKLRYSPLGFNSWKICQHLTNWTRWNNKVWSSVNSLFKWRFWSRRRRCCLSPLINLVPRSLFPGFGKAPWGQGYPLMQHARDKRKETRVPSRSGTLLASRNGELARYHLVPQSRKPMKPVFAFSIIWLPDIC